MHASLKGQLVWTLLSECSQYVLHRHSYTHVHIHGEAEEWHDQASAAKGSSFNYSQPLSVYKYVLCTVHTHNYVQLLTHVAGLSLYLGVSSSVLCRKSWVQHPR